MHKFLVQIKGNIYLQVLADRYSIDNLLDIMCFYLDDKLIFQVMYCYVNEVEEI